MAAIATLRRVGQFCMVEFLPYAIIGTAKVTLIGLDNVHHHLRVLILFSLCNATVR